MPSAEDARKLISPEHAERVANHLADEARSILRRAAEYYPEGGTTSLGSTLAKLFVARAAAEAAKELTDAAARMVAIATGRDY